MEEENEHEILQLLHVLPAAVINGSLWWLMIII